MAEEVADQPPADPPLTLTQMADFLGSILLLADNGAGAPREAFVRLSSRDVYGLRRVHRLLVSIQPYAQEVRRLTVDKPRSKT